MDSLERQIDLLEQVIRQGVNRVGEVHAENAQLKRQVEEFRDELADRSRRLAMLEQAEEKFLGVQRETALLKDERQKLRTELEQLLRKVAALKAAVLQWE
jgi:predicted RNase H-like nuclease (RuvC/YqgF family)